ncbi:MAG: hypothetical protein F6K56_40465 [Moorea sp. SIO3G5]|nr:hypothetical protein [Moorena sp. SIO3G5]
MTNLRWGDDLHGSGCLEELKALSESDGKLSIRLTTFGYNTNKNEHRFTLGKVIGVIGPYDESEPDSFVLGRRMVPNLNQQGSPSNQINFFDGWVDEQKSSVLIDLGNALPLTNDLELQDLGDLQLAVLKDVNTLESDTLSKDDGFVALGDLIPYRTADWLSKTAGIWSAPFLTNQLELISEHPLALIKMLDSDHGEVLIRESIDGLLVRADKFVQRVESTQTADLKLYASRYGKPLPDTSVSIEFSDPENPSGGRGYGPGSPKARIPWTDWPKEALKNLPLKLKTNPAGQAELSIETEDPKNPRDYIDGQLYTLQYLLEGQEKIQKHSLDAIYILLFDAYQIPEKPTWVEHIHPIFQQYGNLYPIMSKRLVDLGDYGSVRENRAILELAFSRDIHDPNYMPVNRDLSNAKRLTILRWLREQYANGSYIMRLGQLKPKREEKAPPAIQETSVKSLSLEPETEDYTIAHGYENFKIALRQNQSHS